MGNKLKCMAWQKNSASKGKQLSGIEKHIAKVLELASVLGNNAEKQF